MGRKSGVRVKYQCLLWARPDSHPRGRVGSQGGRSTSAVFFDCILGAEGRDGVLVAGTLGAEQLQGSGAWREVPGVGSGWTEAGQVRSRWALLAAVSGASSRVHWEAAERFLSGGRADLPL